MSSKLPLIDLDQRHPGITKSIGDTYCEAASVCLARHHQPPIHIEIKHAPNAATCSAEWHEPDARVKGAWANEIDATEFGAYGVSLAALELASGLVAVRRAETRTGADYYLAPAGSEVSDLETCLRLEVSGVDAGDPAAINERVRKKLGQLSKGSKNTPGLAAVVGFRERVVVIEEQTAK
jgi:hypothetical protein